MFTQNPQVMKMIDDYVSQDPIKQDVTIEEISTSIQNNNVIIVTANFRNTETGRMDESKLKLNMLNLLAFVYDKAITMESK